jgi:hypothetical protein
VSSQAILHTQWAQEDNIPDMHQTSQREVEESALVGRLPEGHAGKQEILFNPNDPMRRIQ